MTPTCTPHCHLRAARARTYALALIAERWAVA
jgi:hypothetical protein